MGKITINKAPKVTILIEHYNGLKTEIVFERAERYWWDSLGFTVDGKYEVKKQDDPRPIP